MRGLGIVLLVVSAFGAACSARAVEGPRERPTPDLRPNEKSAVQAKAIPGWMRAVSARLRAGDVRGAESVLATRRWTVEDRARAALLLAGCRLRRKQHGPAMQGLREYLAKAPHGLNPRDATVVHLLRHHAEGGSLRPRDAEEAVYFALYARYALDEPDSALRWVERARAEAPEPELSLLEVP